MMEAIVKRSIRDSVDFLMQFGKLPVDMNHLVLRWRFRLAIVNTDGDVALYVREDGSLTMVHVENWMKGRSIAELTDFLGAVKYLVSFYCNTR